MFVYSLPCLWSLGIVSLLAFEKKGWDSFPHSSCFIALTQSQRIPTMVITVNTISKTSGYRSLRHWCFAIWLFCVPFDLMAFHVSLLLADTHNKIQQRRKSSIPDPESPPKSLCCGESMDPHINRIGCITNSSETHWQLLLWFLNHYWVYWWKSINLAARNSQEQKLGQCQRAKTLYPTKASIQHYILWLRHTSPCNGSLSMLGSRK